MGYIANDILQDCAFVLVEPVVNTVLGTVVAPGVVTVMPASMKAIYVGAQLIIDSGVSLEVVTVSAIGTTTFTATFANAHLATAVVKGATFPSGQTDNPLFTQAEMLNSLASSQNEFLMRTAAIYNIAPVTLATDQRYYTQPADCMRLERISIEGNQLYDCSQRDLDLQDPTWTTKVGKPTHWFQDDINKEMYGFKPLPPVGFLGSLWYGQRASSSLGLADALVLPAIFCQYLKYGVLAKCFEKDGEMRDPFKAEYCEKRTEFGTLLALSFMLGAAVEPTHKSRSGSKFSGMRQLQGE